MTQRYAIAERRFWLAVDCSRTGVGECWPWMGMRGGRTSTKYGHVKINGQDVGAHRVAWELAFGPIPPGLFVCHRCDNPPCCKPSHLFLGTAGDNNRDSASKGRKITGDNHYARTQPERLARGNRNGSRARPDRVPRGEAHGRAKLATASVISIRALHATGVLTQAGLAARFGIGQQAVSRVLSRQSWNHVKEESNV